MTTKTESKAKILIAEPVEWIRLSYVSLLEEYGYEVDQAVDGEEAIQKLKSSCYHIIILSLMMPHKNAYEVMKFINKSSFWFGCVIVVNQFQWTGFNVRGLCDKVFCMKFRGVHVMTPFGAPQDILNSVQSRLQEQGKEWGFTEDEYLVTKKMNTENNSIAEGSSNDLLFKITKWIKIIGWVILTVVCLFFALMIAFVFEW